MTYSLDTIIAAWGKYDRAKAFCVLKDGKWKNVPMEGEIGVKDKLQGGVQAKIRPLQDVMDFPTYLELHWKDKWVSK